MSRYKRAIIVIVIPLVVVTIASAQFGGKGKGGPQPPMLTIQNPVMNSGADYTMKVKDKQMDVAYAIVGKEDVKGDPGFWLETRVQMAELSGEMINKMLMVPTGSEPGMKRMITQAPGQEPMEMSGMLMSMMKARQPDVAVGKADFGELVGTESVTVPAGTFSCQHYRKPARNGQIDYWVDPQVTSFGVVKMTTPEMTMVLNKVLTNENSHVKGEPKKKPEFQMPHF